MLIAREERVTLATLGVVVLLGLAMLLWQRRHPALTVTSVPSAVAQSLDSASRPRSGFRSTGQPRGASWDAALAQARQVDINTADVAELERLPQVGPVLAGRIVAYRSQHGPFRSADDLGEVQGIGPKKSATLAAYVTASQR